MYSAAKSFIRSNNVTDDLFECNIRVSLHLVYMYVWDSDVGSISAS